LLKSECERQVATKMQKHTVLVVDDESIVRESIRDWFKDAGYEVTTAATGEEALEMVNRQGFDALIVDMRLPGMTGLEVLRKVKALRPQVKCVVMTAFPLVEVAVEAMKLGAVDYLVKPVAPDHLEKLIRQTLGN